MTQGSQGSNGTDMQELNAGYKAASFLQYQPYCISQYLNTCTMISED